MTLARVLREEGRVFAPPRGRQEGKVTVFGQYTREQLDPAGRPIISFYIELCR